MFERIIFVSLFITAVAHANSVDFRYTQSLQTISTQASLSGDFAPRDQENKENVEGPVLSWDASYSEDKSSATDPNTGVMILDTTKSWESGLSAETVTHFNFGLSLNYANTPEEQLDSVGPTINLGYRYYFEAPSEEFSPSIGASFSYGIVNNNQSFNSRTIPRRQNLPSKPIFGNNIIIQNSFNTNLTIKMFPWVTLKGSYTKFEYNRDINQFLQFVDSPVLSKVSSGISNALSGFYFYTWKVQTTVYFLQIWSLDLSHSVSHVATDLSFSTENDVILMVDLGPSWQLGGGLELISSTAAGAENSTTSLGKLSYSF